MNVPLLVVIDVVSGIAMLGLAAAFFALWRFTRDALHLLFGLALAVLAVGISIVSASEFDVARASEIADGVRIIGQTAAPLMLATAYWFARIDRPVNAWGIALASLAVATAFAALAYVLPPAGGFAMGSLRNTFLLSHALQFVLYLALVVLSARSFTRRPGTRRALVPVAFLAYAFSKYTWVLIDVQGDTRLVPAIYFWRFLMLGLLVAALAMPFLRGVDDHAQA